MDVQQKEKITVVRHVTCGNWNQRPEYQSFLPPSECGATVVQGAGSAQDLSGRNLVQPVESCLRNLDANILETLKFECWDPDTPDEEIMRTLRDLVRQGKFTNVQMDVEDLEDWQVKHKNQIAQKLALCENLASHITAYVDQEQIHPLRVCRAWDGKVKSANYEDEKIWRVLEGMKNIVQSGGDNRTTGKDGIVEKSGSGLKFKSLRL